MLFRSVEYVEDSRGEHDLVEQSELLHHPRPDNVGRATWIHKHMFNLKCIHKKRNYQCVIMRLGQGLGILFDEYESILWYIAPSSLFPGDGYFYPLGNGSLWGVDPSNDHVDDVMWFF